MKKMRSKKKSLIGHPQSTFARFARATSTAAGHPTAFGVAATVILMWAITGPVFHFSDTWQLLINTGTTIATFLMVFLIQNTQNRDAQAMQLKLDELLRATRGAHTALMDLEEMTEEELSEIKCCYTKAAEKGRKDLREGGGDTGTPDILFETFAKKA